MQLEQSIALAENHLARQQQRDYSTLCFEWHGMDFSSQYAHLDDGSHQIQINGELGRLPYTIENSQNRANAINAIYLANRTHDGAYQIERNGRVQYRCLTQTDTRLFGHQYLEAITAIMLHNSQHLLLVKSLLKETPTLSARTAA